MTPPTTQEAGLKPCPFCGGDTIHTRIIETTDPTSPYVYHECDRCQVETTARDRDEAIEAWNTRAAPSPEPMQADLRETIARIVELAIERHGVSPGDLEGTLDDADDILAAMQAKSEPVR